MFKSIAYRSVAPDYLLRDTEFDAEITSSSSAMQYLMGHILTEYQRRKLDIPKNAILVYQYFGHSLKENRLNSDAPIIDAAFPHLQYKTKYLPCIKRRIELMKWVNRGG